VQEKVVDVSNDIVPMGLQDVNCVESELNKDHKSADEEACIVEFGLLLK